MPDLILQSEGTNELRETTVRLVDSSGIGVSGIAGSATIKICKASGTAFVSPSGGTALTEITGSAGGLGGVYRLRFDSADADVVGDLKFEISHTSIQTLYGYISVRPAHRALDFADNFITAAKIATDAIDADALKTDAVDEIKAAAATAVWAAAKASNRTANTMGEVLQVVMAALGVNAMIDTITYGTNGLPTIARVRVFEDSTALDAATPGAGGDEGAIYKFAESAVDLTDNGKFSSMKPRKRTL